MCEIPDLMTEPLLPSLQSVEAKMSPVHLVLVFQGGMVGVCVLQNSHREETLLQRYKEDIKSLFGSTFVNQKD